MGKEKGVNNTEYDIKKLEGTAWKRKSRDRIKWKMPTCRKDTLINLKKMIFIKV